ncbi:MAG: Gx transporter family protein [Candidatus Cloacimonetes bacterium]|nr:Gx transporter family protein [Candidatus Cloacimonadota bacterium]
MSKITKNNKDKIIIIAFFTAFAATLYLAENLIPRPLPFLKFGLANIVVLILLFQKKTGIAFIVGISKTIIGGFLSGTLFNPSTVFSLVGTLGSLLVMIFFLKFHIGFSLIGISILGAVTHNICQIFSVRLILIRDDSIYYLIPMLIIIGLVTGFVTGYFANMLKPFFDSIFQLIDKNIQPIGKSE